MNWFIGRQICENERNGHPWSWHKPTSKCRCEATPDSKVHGANMGPTWVLSAPDGPHVGPWTLLSVVLVNFYIQQMVQIGQDMSVHSRDLYLVTPTLASSKNFQYLSRAEEIFTKTTNWTNQGHQIPYHPKDRGHQCPTFTRHRPASSRPTWKFAGPIKLLCQENCDPSQYKDAILPV